MTLTSSCLVHVSLRMEMTEGLLSSPDFVLLPASPHAESMPPTDSLVSSAATNALCDESNPTMCTPLPGITATVLEMVSCRRREGRKVRRYGGRRSKTPYARRRLVF